MITVNLPAGTFEALAAPVEMTKYESYIQRQKQLWRGTLSESGLDPRFISYFNSGQRIKVETCGMIITGTVGVTTGWLPCFLLMRSKRSVGSSWTLGPKDKILAVQNGKIYKQVETRA